MSQADSTGSANGTLYFRHTLAIRVMHWINVLAFSLLLMSGLQIFNAHPALNWGKSSYNGRPAVLKLGAMRDAQGHLVGVTRIFGYTFDTTGVLAVSEDANGRMSARGFPAWMTVPVGMLRRSLSPLSSQPPRPSPATSSCKRRLQCGARSIETNFAISFSAFWQTSGATGQRWAT